jgi:hypothetical protein
MVYQKGISLPKKAMKLRRVPIAAKSTFAQMGYLDSTSLAGKLFFRNHLHDRAESLVERRNPYSVCFGYYFAGDKSLALVTFSPVNPYGYNGGFSSSRMELPASRAD